MNVIVGKYAGFCPGVENTIEKALESLKNNETIYCLGEIIHNESVIDELKGKGMIFVEQVNKVPNGSKMIIRAHGEAKDVYELAKDKNIHIIDLTCVKVSMIHKKVENKSSNHFILIIGKHKHPEVIGTKGHVGNNSYVIENDVDIDASYELFKSTNLKSVYIVSQTTFNSRLFDELIDKIKSVYKNVNIIVDKTICKSTEIRQNEVSELSKIVDKVLIVGGKNSSNTKELQTIAERYCKNCYLVQDKTDLKDLKLETRDNIGIVAGASTPKKIIEEIKVILESNFTCNE